MSLEVYGWTKFFSEPFETYRERGLSAARVTLQNRGHYGLQTGEAEIEAGLTGRLRHDAQNAADLPVVGDWVVVKPADGGASAVIHDILPRKTRLSRNVAGQRTEEQVVAANVDTVFLVMGLDGDFNLRRMERLLATAWESGALPVVVLNKADLSDDAEARRRDVERVAPGVAVLLLSAREDRGLEQLRPFLNEGETVVLIGSSGVGKSTLINRLLGRDVMRTAEVRDGDDRGRHTTTHRQMFELLGGGLLIDNPGLREIQLWSSDGALGDTFEEIEALAEKCRFSDCQHSSEPGCAVLAAVGEGNLAEERLNSYRNLQRELRYLEIKQDEGAERAERKKWKAIQKAYNKMQRQRGR
jgi:ribosome biogenesis GTPase